MLRQPLTLTVLDESYAVVRLTPSSPVPAWLPATGFTSVTRTNDELSIVCTETAVPSQQIARRGFRLLRVEGPLPFEMVGVMASLSGVLAAAGVSLLALSTHDTDYLLVGDDALERAHEALRRAGHRVNGR